MNHIIKKCRICDVELINDNFNPGNRRCKQCIIKTNTIRNREYMREYYVKYSAHIKQNQKSLYQSQTNRSVIYKIRCKNSDVTEIYIGSTINIQNRMNNHRKVFNNPNSKSYNCMLYSFIRDNGGWENWEAVIIREFDETVDRNDLFQYEGYYINKLCPLLNKCRPKFNLIKHEIENLD